MPFHMAMPWIGHVVVTAVVVSGGALSDDPGAGFVWSTDTVLVDAAAAAILLARHRAPFVVLPAVVALVAVGVSIGVFNPGLPVAVAVAVYTAVLNTSRRKGMTIAAVVAALMLVAVAVDGYNGFQSVLTVLLGGAVGEAVRTQRGYVAAVTERAERAERTREAPARQRVAETRLAIARDLNDVVAHQISVINLHAGVAASALRDRPAAAEKSLAIVRRASRTVLAEIGDLMATLRDPDAGTGPPGLAQLDDVVRAFATGGMRIMRTLGRKIIELDPPQGFAAEATAASVLYVASMGLGAPVSTTHVISSAIMGVGSTKRLTAVRWGTAGNMVVAWITTFPAVAIIAAVTLFALGAFA